MIFKLESFLKFFRVYWLVMTTLDEAINLIKMGAEEVLLVDELKKKLESGKPLTVKLGADPTAPDIHLGHTVVLNKLRQFQDLGHNVKFLIGDFTSLIGDPTGKNATRKPLEIDEIRNNAKTYKEQIFKILDPNKTEVVFNSSWLSELGTVGMIKLAAKYNVARMLERDDFKKRYKSNVPIAVHEFLYPLLQGYDSVAMNADIELGGTDQKFNLLVGRELQKQHSQDPQVVIMMPLLEGLDGVNKMSKSLNNYIGINEEPTSIFGKIMSISDELMWRYFTLVSTKSPKEVNDLKARVTDGENPRDIKFLLAKDIITRFHNEEDAEKAQNAFVTQFQKGEMPDSIEEMIIEIPNDGLKITNLLKLAGMVSSSKDGQRMIAQGAVKIEGEKVTDPNLIIAKSTSNIYQVGRRKYLKITTN